MAVHDDFPKILFMEEKVVPDPQKIPLVLLLQRHFGPHARMGKEIVPVRERRCETEEKMMMAIGQRSTERRCGFLLCMGVVVASRRLNTVREKRGDTAHLQPLGQYRRFAQRLNCKELVIAFQTENLVLSLAVDEQIKHTTRIRSTIDIVAEEDLHGVPYRPGAQILVNPREQCGQKIGSPVYVANSVNAFSDRGARFCLFPGGRA